MLHEITIYNLQTIYIWNVLQQQQQQTLQSIWNCVHQTQEQYTTQHNTKGYDNEKAKVIPLQA